MPERIRPFKVWLPITGLFILAGLYILALSFVVNVECPRSLSPEECSNYLKSQRVQEIVPIFISYGFLFMAFVFWYYYWWSTSR